MDHTHRRKHVCTPRTFFESKRVRKSPKTFADEFAVSSRKYQIYLRREILAGAVGFEIASLQNKSCTVNGVVPPPQFQLLLNVVNPNVRRLFGNADTKPFTRSREIPSLRAMAFGLSAQSRKFRIPSMSFSSAACVKSAWKICLCPLKCASEAEKPLEFQVVLDLVRFELRWHEHPLSFSEGNRTAPRRMNHPPILCCLKKTGYHTC